MNFQTSYNLQPHNTFHLKCWAKHFVQLTSEKDLSELVNSSIFKTNKRLILGGGSNILFTQDFDGLVIKNELKGKTIISENKDIILELAAGEIWHNVVLYCMENNWGGVENLSLIPGCVGAAPIQNIGAYGVELKDVFHSLRFYHFETKKIELFDADACAFGYRNSIFKNDLKGKGVILSVQLKLTKHNHQLNTGYGAIQQVLKKHEIENPTIKTISDAVIAIRESKLPNPEVIGNAGSFFKNPELPKEQVLPILEKYPQAPHYIINEKTIKLPAGWLIDQCGWKGFKDGEIGVHDKQALVLVNRGNGKGRAIYQLAKKIIDDVKTTFGIELTPEVNVV